MLAASSAPFIEYRNVSKAFGERRILEDVSCSISEGHTAVMLGPSGVGKSVFSKLLIGLMKPDSGEIWVDGREVTHLSGRELLEYRKQFGMLFQDGALFDWLTVEENVAFPLRRHTRAGESEIARRVAEALEHVGLAREGGKQPSELSGGMRKRAALARAMILHPRILIFDEPNSGLDPVTSDAIDSLIVHLKREMGITFLVISHDIVSAFLIADDIGMLHQGRLIAYGPREDLRESRNPVVVEFLSRARAGLDPHCRAESA